MNVATLMERVWKRVLPRLQALRDRLARRWPALTCDLGQHSTEVFPLTGYASISLSGNRQDEDLVVSVSCRLEAGELECTADIANGQGTILADGPSAEIDLALDEDQVNQLLGTWISAVEGFLDESASNLVVALEERR